MKKLLAILTLALCLLGSSLTFASNGSLLDLEEQFVVLFVDRGNYIQFQPLLSDAVKSDFSEASYNKYRKEVNSKCGKMVYRKLRIYEKMDDADVLQYEVKFAKDKNPYIYEFAFDVSTGKPLLVNFELVTTEEIQGKK